MDGVSGHAARSLPPLLASPLTTVGLAEEVYSCPYSPGTTSRAWVYSVPFRIWVMVTVTGVAADAMVLSVIELTTPPPTASK